MPSMIAIAGAIMVFVIVFGYITLTQGSGGGINLQAAGMDFIGSSFAEDLLFPMLAMGFIGFLILNKIAAKRGIKLLP